MRNLDQTAEYVGLSTELKLLRVGWPRGRENNLVLGSKGYVGVVIHPYSMMRCTYCVHTCTCV